MEMQNLTNDAIRQAMATGQYELAERLWNGYMARLQEELQRGSLTQASLDDAREILEWSRLTMACARARAQSRLGSLHIAGAYDYAPPAPSPRIIQSSF